MNAISRRYRIIILLILAGVTLITGIALVFGFLYRPDNENLSRAGSFAGVIGTTAGVLIAAYAIFVEFKRAELRHEEANAAWGAAIRLRSAIASVDWLIPDAGQKAWIIASACRPPRTGTAWVVREMGSVGLPGSEGDSYLAGLRELHEAISVSIATSVGRVLGVAWNSEVWETENRAANEVDDSRGVLAARSLVELMTAIRFLIEQRRAGLMALPDALTLAQLQAIFRALNNSRDDDAAPSGNKASRGALPNLTLMRDFRSAYENDGFEDLASDTFLAFYLEEYGAWMGQLLPFVGLALPFSSKDGEGSTDWVPLGESDRLDPKLLRPTISQFVAWSPERPFSHPVETSALPSGGGDVKTGMTPHVWDASALASELSAASQAGNAEATNALGVLYACLKPRNYAFAPLELAVQQGSINAKANLGIMHYHDALEKMPPSEPADSPDALKSWSQALDWFQQVRDEAADHPLALMFGGLLAYEANEFTDAEGFFRQAFNRGVLPAAGALKILAAKRGDFVAAIAWRNNQAAFLDSYRADDPLEVLATLYGYALGTW